MQNEAKFKQINLKKELLNKNNKATKHFFSLFKNQNNNQPIKNTSIFFLYIVYIILFFYLRCWFLFYFCFFVACFFVIIYNKIVSTSFVSLIFAPLQLSVSFNCVYFWTSVSEWVIECSRLYQQIVYKKKKYKNCDWRLLCAIDWRVWVFISCAKIKQNIKKRVIWWISIDWSDGWFRNQVSNWLKGIAKY